MILFFPKNMFSFIPVELTGARKYEAARRLMGVWSCNESTPLRHGAKVYRRHEAYTLLQLKRRTAKAKNVSGSSAVLPLPLISSAVASSFSSSSSSPVPVFSPRHAQRNAIATLDSLTDKVPLYLYRNADGRCVEIIFFILFYDRIPHLFNTF
jgi:hypothetical protein